MVLPATQETADREKVFEAEAFSRTLGELDQSVEETLRAREKLAQSVAELNRSLAACRANRSIVKCSLQQRI